MNHGYRHIPDYDRCGWGTPWGCKQEIDLGSEVSLVLDACQPEDVFDNGHRLFHTACMPVSQVRPVPHRTLVAASASERSRRRVGLAH